jgi:hypothetical protein
MASPARASFTAHGGNPTTSATVTLPTTAANDILILSAVNGGATAALTTSGTYSGGAWTATGLAAAMTASWGGSWYSRCTGNHSGQTVIVGTATDSCSAGVLRITGAITSGSPLDTNTSATTLTANGLALSAFTTTVAETLVIYAGAWDDNIAPSSVTKGGAAMTLDAFSSTGGADSGGMISSLSQATAASTGAFAGTHASALSKRLMAFAIKPVVVADLRTDRFRARDDNVTLNSGTWTYATNTDFSQPVDTTFRIRFQVGEVNAVDATWDGTLEANLNSGGWQDVTTSSTVVKAVVSSQFNDGDATTDLLAETGDPGVRDPFEVGEGVEDGNPADIVLNASHVEHEYALQIVGADVANNDIVLIRPKGMTTVPGETNMPNITVVKLASLGAILNTDTTEYAGTLGAESNTSTYGATTLGAQESSANSYPP